MALRKSERPRVAIPSSAGYSGTPLAKKLGIKEGSTVLLIGEPDGYFALLDPLPSHVVFKRHVSQGVDLVHLFVTHQDKLKKVLTNLREKLRADGAVWVSWPKKSAKVATDITEDSIREIALPLGFVDIKVCAVSEIWSGLKLVVRKELR